MKPVLLSLMMLLLACETYAQNNVYKELLKKIEQRTSENQWDEVIILATDLLTEDPTKGDGYYYTAMAFMKLGDSERAFNYLNRATALADEKLKKKIDALKSSLSQQGNLKSTLATAEKLQQEGKHIEAAKVWQNAWKEDKKQFSYALNAVENYVLAKKFPEALEILKDPSVANESKAKELVSRINSTDQMKNIYTAAEVIEKGKDWMKQGYPSLASASFEEALRLNPNATEAKQLKAIADDDNAWAFAKNYNTVGSLQDYEKGPTAKLHLDEARQKIVELLFSEGQWAANRHMISDMEKNLDQIISTYGNQEQKQRARSIKCAGYESAAFYYSTKQAYFEQNQAVKYFTKANQQCTGKQFDAQIANASKLAKKYGHASTGFINFVTDKYSTLGLSAGRINNQKIGGYWTMRMKDYFSDKAYYTVNNNNQLSGNINTNIRRSTGKETKMINIEGVVGVTAKLTYPVWMYAGVGIAENNTLWLMNEYNTSNTQTGSGWAKNTDLSGSDVVVETGIILTMGKLNVMTGFKYYDSQKSTITFGIGICR